MNTKGKQSARHIQLDIGKIIQDYRMQHNLTKSAMARSIHRKPIGFSRMIRQKSMQTYIIWELSAAYGHNFFDDLSKQFLQSAEGQGILSQPAEGQKADEIAALNATIEQLRQERDYLKKMVDIFSKLVGNG